MLKNTWITLGILAVTVAVMVAGILWYEDQVLIPQTEPASVPGEVPFLEPNHNLVTVNTTRIGSDDPVQTAVAVAQIIYPVTEEGNTPGAIVLVNRNLLPEVMVATSRVQHFPVNAPILYVDENSIPDLTRKELLRLKPEGVMMDGNTQVYLFGTISDAVASEVQQMGFQIRQIQAADIFELAEDADNWSATQHGNHQNDVVIANLDSLAPAIPSIFWNAHMGDGLAFVTNEGVPEATRRILQRRAHGPWIYVFGDESVVPDLVVRELAQYGQVTRIPGSSASETSAHFAAFHDEGKDWGAWFLQGARSFGWGIGEAGHNAIFVRLDGPAGWQNAVPATTLSHMGKHAPVLVLDSAGQIPEAVKTYLKLTAPYETAPRQQLTNHGWIIGGEGTISWETQAQIDLYLDTIFSAKE